MSPLEVALMGLGVCMAMAASWLLGRSYGAAEQRGVNRDLWLRAYATGRSYEKYKHLAERRERAQLAQVVAIRGSKGGAA